MRLKYLRQDRIPSTWYYIFIFFVINANASVFAWNHGFSLIYIYTVRIAWDSASRRFRCATLAHFTFASLSNSRTATAYLSHRRWNRINSDFKGMSRKFRSDNFGDVNYRRRSANVIRHCMKALSRRCWLLGDNSAGGVISKFIYGYLSGGAVNLLSPLRPLKRKVGRGGETGGKKRKTEAFFAPGPELELK